MTTGERIRAARTKRGMTQREVGEKCGIAEPTIRRYELGKLNPKYETLQRIASALDVPVEALLSSNPILRPPKNELETKLEALPVFEHRGQLVADSRDVAAMIGRQHGHVMRTVHAMYKHLTQSKIGVSDFFIPATYKDSTGRSSPCYYLTEMGCEMVANKQTGEAGTIFTAQYVKAFHAMRDFIRERATPEWQETRSLGKEIRRMETDAIKTFVAYAEAQGSQHAARYYQSISTLANRAAGIKERDKAHVAELVILLMAEKVIAREVQAGMKLGKPYREIFEAAKARVSDFFC